MNGVGVSVPFGRELFPQEITNGVGVLTAEYIPGGHAFLLIFVNCIKHNIYRVRHIHMQSRGPETAFAFLGSLDWE
jgi:hypothetical protein